jgi:hypothetical protein
MSVSLFQALMALLMSKGPTVNENDVRAVLADPQSMAKEVVALKAELEAEMNAGAFTQTPPSVAFADAIDPTVSDTAMVGTAHDLEAGDLASADFNSEDA